jgi:hypothetical protein
MIATTMGSAVTELVFVTWVSEARTAPSKRAQTTAMDSANVVGENACVIRNIGERTARNHDARLTATIGGNV